MPAPKDQSTSLGWVMLGWEHLQAQRPIAAWASWRQALVIEPENAAALQALDRLESSPQLPHAAKRPWTFQSPDGPEAAERWDRVLKAEDTARLDDAVTAFGRISEGDPTDVSAAFNHVLCLAWSGENPRAIRRIQEVLPIATARNFTLGVSLATLGAILRQGAGAEEYADALRYHLDIPWDLSGSDPQDAFDPEIPWRPVSLRGDPMLGLPTPDVARVYEWIDRPPLDAAETFDYDDVPEILALVVVSRDRVRLTSTDPFRLLALQEHLESRALPPGEFLRAPLPIAMMDAGVWSFRLPEGLAPETRGAIQREAVEHYFEFTWIARPFLSLADDDSFDQPQTPAQAAARVSGGDSVSRAKLTALVDLAEQLGERPATVEMYQGYPFDRLRHRLGLSLNGDDLVDPAEIASMSLPALRSLDLASLDTTELAEVIDSALAFDDDELHDEARKLLNARE
jgi:hypothetical protein